MKTFSNKLPALLCVVVWLIQLNSIDAQQTLINTKHLDHLYEEINVEGNKLGIVHIYCEYPDYKWVDDSDEGIACVDDVSRAAIFYMNYSRRCNDSASHDKAKKLIEFVLHMQAENGFFYNFIFPDYSINETHQNSIAEPNWWSWRALLSLTEAYGYFKNSDKEFSVRIKSAIKETIDAVKKHFHYEKRIVELDGFNRPSWLPFQYASDQAALIVTALCKYNYLFADNSVLNLINDFCEGILLMQEGNDNEFPFHALMSWENSWHAWGNLQSYSLLCAYEITHEEKYLNASLNEINHFYRFLLREKFLNEFSVKKEKGKTVLDSKKKFSQIAYGITPMIYSLLKAEELTRDKKYSLLAAETAEWFFGRNPAEAKIYFEQTGICYDGIVSENELNKNSGAESTIEALLSLSAIEGNEDAFCTLKKIFTEKK